MSNLAAARLSFLERAVWVAAGMVTILTYLFASVPTARGALAGALVAASNHTASRLILSQMIRQPGPARGLFALSYGVRIIAVLVVMVFLMWGLKLSPVGLALGLLSFPLAIVALLLRELLRTTPS